MTSTARAGVVVDTMVISWLLDDRPNALSDNYRALIGASPVLLAFQTVMELRFGALRAGWGEFRRRRLEERIAELTVVQPDDDMITACSSGRTVRNWGTHSEARCTTVTAGSRQLPSV